MIRVSLIEDDSPTRDALEILLKGTPGFQFVSAHANAPEAFSRMPLAKVDVALLDIGLPGVNGIECLRGLKQKKPDLRVIMFTVHEEADALFEALKAGANGYILKRTPPAEILGAIQEVVDGGAPMTPSIARKVLQHFHGMTPAKGKIEDLTTRENEVLHNLSLGYTYKEIASALHISPETVRNHLRHIYEKLHVHSRTEALMAYVRK